MPASKGAAGFCWQAVERALERARGANALRDIPTVPRRHGKFVLRLSENLRQKPKLEEASGVLPISRPKRPDPFERNNLDPDLVVCDLGSGHTVLLNKFPVVSPHLLVVTRDFEPQTDLSAADYGACLSVLGQWRGEDGGLAFYNSGPHSGMSQPHRHVQVVPNPPSCYEREVEEAVEGRAPEDGPVPVPGLPFLALACRVDAQSPRAPEVLASLAKRARDLLPPTNPASASPSSSSSSSYNLLLTTRWWVFVPRTSAEVGPLGVNALGFAGQFLLRTQEERDHALGVQGGLDLVLAQAGVPAQT